MSFAIPTVKRLRMNFVLSLKSNNMKLSKTISKSFFRSANNRVNIKLLIIITTREQDVYIYSNKSNSRIRYNSRLVMQLVHKMRNSCFKNDGH